MIPRFNVLTLLIFVTTASALVTLNTLETITMTEPRYATLMGAVPHPPPYGMYEMVVTFHRDRGWPIWHTRASNHYMAHNAGLYFVEDGLLKPDFFPETDYFHVAVNVCVGLFILIAVGVASESYLRRHAKWHQFSLQFILALTAFVALLLANAKYDLVRWKGDAAWEYLPFFFIAVGLWCVFWTEWKLVGWGIAKVIETTKTIP